MENNGKRFDLVFDIGANIGNATSYLLTRSNKVIAVEPNPNLVARLKQKYKDNNVVVIEKGVSNTIDTKTFFISKQHVLSTFSSNWKTNSRFANQTAWESEIQVETTTLDALVREYGAPNFIKIDVEGHEFEVIKGCTKLLDTTLFGFEWTEELFSAVEDIVRYAQELGYMSYAFTYGDCLQDIDSLIFKKWESLDIHKNINPSRKSSWGMIYFKK